MSPKVSKKVIPGGKEPYRRFALYFVVTVFLLLVGQSLFVRFDLTKYKTYTLSEESKKVVKSLTQPMTIRVFISPRLPQPYNNIEQSLQDLLKEYASLGNKNFNYVIYKMEPGKKDENGRAYTDIAAQYSVNPVSIQTLQNDEAKVIRGYVGLAVSYGDFIESIPAIEQQENLEMNLTSTMAKVSRRINVLRSLKDKVEVVFYLSPELSRLDSGFASYADELRKVVKKVNRKNYGVLEYRRSDPSLAGKGKNSLKPLLLPQKEGKPLSVYAGIELKYRGESTAVPILHRGLLGLQLLPPADLEQVLDNSIPLLLHINQTLGYWTGNGSKTMVDFSFFGQGSDPSQTAANLVSYLNKNYDVKEASGEKIPEGAKTLIIAGPKQKFSDWELFQIDQFLMKGNSLTVFLDPYRALPQQRQNQFFGRQPTRYVKNETGLDRLLKFYGVDVVSAYALDKKSLKQTRQLPKAQGGGLQEMQLYAVPDIYRSGLDVKSPITRNIGHLIFPFVAPLRLTDSGDQTKPLVKTSPESWLMDKNIQLENPLAIFPPAEKDKFKVHPLSYLLEKKFKSYFQGKELPLPPAEPGTGESEQTKGGEKVFKTLKQKQPDFIAAAQKPGKLFVIGGSYIASNGLINSLNQPTAVFLLNTIDSLSGRDGFISMRSKGIGYSPIQNKSPVLKILIRNFNTFGLPVLVILIGLSVWLKRKKRKQALRLSFSGTKKEQV